MTRSPRAPLLAARTALAALVALTAAMATPLAAQNPPPDGDWLEFDTEHFRVIYHAGLEDLARHAALVAERTHEILRADLVRAPRGTIEMVVTDHVDFSNGYATPFSTNRIVVFARPPLTMPGLAFSRDWLELVVAHELVHIFHLEHAGTVGRGIRAVFGRLPFVWPIFPALGTPTWNVEGIATYYESQLTGGGRVQGTYHDMVIRTAALESEIPALRRVSDASPVWPAGERSYVYGAALMQWIADQYGHDAHTDLAHATYGSVLPTFLFFDHVARQALGRSFTAVYDDWRAVATDSAHALRARIAATGITPVEPVVRHGPYAVAPRTSPDGRLLSYAAHDYRSDPATRIVDLATGETRGLARRNQFGSLLGPASWLPDGSGLVLAQLEYRGRYRLFSDLWLVDLDGRERRLTRNQRLAQPDVAPDGRRVVAAQNHDGSIRLVEHDLATGESRVIAAAAAGGAFDSPRWAPDGRRVAVTRYADGQVDIVVVDAVTGELTPLTSDESLAGAPAWSPDGRWVLFWSDRTGIPNLYAARAPAAGDTASPVGQGSAWQVTNVLTGAFEPEVSPDGSTLFFVAYHHDGWRVVRTPFDTTAWQPAAPPLVRYEPGLLPRPTPLRTAQPAPAATADPGATRPTAPNAPPIGGAARPYVAGPGVLPYFWTPSYQSVGSAATGQWSRFIGLYTMGWDVLQRHTWSAAGAYDIDTGRSSGSASWTWAGLGSPDLVFSAQRSWSPAGWIAISETQLEGVLARQDRLAADAVFWSRRWRRTAWLGAGGDIRRDGYQTYQMDEASLAQAGYRLVQPPTLAGASLRPGFSNVRLHPYGISRQDGITTALGAGRWWDITNGVHAYDQLNGSLAAFRGHRLWGYADHVAGARVAGARRTGEQARILDIGGAPGGVPDLARGTTTAGPYLPVRGFREGERIGTRAWAATAEYRFPLYLHGAHAHVLGFSLTSVAGSLFADAGDAWCAPAERDSDAVQFAACPAPGAPVLASTGAEITVTIGVLHGFPLAVRLGFAVPLSGTDDRTPALHLGIGPSF
jgi:Tol biopolymer transport system component